MKDKDLSYDKIAKNRAIYLIYQSSPGLMEVLNGFISCAIGVWILWFKGEITFFAVVEAVPKVFLGMLFLSIGVFQVTSFLLNFIKVRSIMAFSSAMIWTFILGISLVRELNNLETAVFLVLTVSNLWVNYRLNYDEYC